jgi:hypothetical protein
MAFRQPIDLGVQLHERFVDAEAALTRKAFLTMDDWLAAIEADTSGNPIEAKIVSHRPAGAVDFC